MMDSVLALLSSIVDYAGLFPPAKLDMAPAVANYAKYRVGEHAWMLGRFIVPAVRLEEFEAAAEPLLPRAETADLNKTGSLEPWRISALIGEDLDGEIDRIFAFNRRHDPSAGGVGLAVVDAIELKASSALSIDKAMGIIPEQLEPFFEIPIDADPRGLITAIAGTGARAKVRTGGVTPDAFPQAGHLARFLSLCAAADVPFKATAGLHHPVCGEFPLTYEAGGPRGMMYGFLNVFLAAAFVRSARMSAEDAARVIAEKDRAAFKLEPSGASWRDRKLDNTRLAHVRETFALSFGSCSFEEPVADLKGMGMV